ncbi:MAG: LytTR family DNA-binding domain-containing protein [Acidobacteria bacterium]|nr:LytTR family DNA-binding domain-containing protein [Acidobacteriota bacterium]
MDKIRVLIVDDEPIARTGIRRELERDPDTEVVGECTNGRDAVSFIRERAPDLVFLDLQMPELDGFGVVEQVGVERMPVVVFVTAFDEFALKAFELHALDYVLKPFNGERFRKALRRAKTQARRAGAAELSGRLLSLIRDAGRAQEQGLYLERVVVKTGGRIFLLSVAEIDWIEAADNYVRLHAGRESHLVQGALGRLESRLDPKLFLRVHRSAIVNVTRIKELQPLFHGEYAIRLTGGKEITSSRGYRDKLQRLLENAF